MYKITAISFMNGEHANIMPDNEQVYSSLQQE